jgi:hypothetical protein
MITISTWGELARALDSPLDSTARATLSAHRDRLAEYGDYDLSELARFAILEPGDQTTALEQASGIRIFVDPPTWESIDDLGGWFELVWVLSDDGFGWVVLVPDCPGTDRALLRLCRSHA